jgi:DNA-binding FadR family transcriptional regulator
MLDPILSKFTIADIVTQQIRQPIVDRKLRRDDKFPANRKQSVQLRVGRPAIRATFTKPESMVLLRMSHSRIAIVKRTTSNLCR